MLSLLHFPSCLTAPTHHSAESICFGTAFVIPTVQPRLSKSAVARIPSLSAMRIAMVLTLTWLSTAIMAPAALAHRAMKQGHAAFARKNFVAARPHLERAARYEPLREEAICLMAEASLYAGKAGDALYALNTLLMEQDQFGKPRSSRVRLLRGIAGCILGRSAAAR